MGYGSYSHEAHRAITRTRAKLPRQEVFKQRTCHPLMDPQGVGLRESRDSDAHPRSVGVVFALDVTGSMGAIPDTLARKELPGFMRTLMDCGVEDPQLLFMAVGDAYSDAAPLQVGQFESAAEKMDQWLTWSYLEGKGGAFGAESYELALYFAARHIEMDCWLQRQRRGYLFMTGDELPYPQVSRSQVRRLIGDELEEDLPLAPIVSEVEERFEPFFLIPDQRRRAHCERAWRDLLGDHVICMDTPEDTCRVASGLVALCEGAVRDLDELAERMKAMGVPRKRLGAVIRALTPFAASRALDSAPEPRLEEAPLPDGDEKSGHRRA